MKQLTMILALCAGPAAADPLGLIDYEGLFADNAAQVEVVSPDRAILQVGAVTILRGNEENLEYTGLDESGQGAVGCFVSVLASLEGALQACDIALTTEQAAARDEYRAMALGFYAENAAPPTNGATVMALYDELVASEVDVALPFCSDPAQFVTFAERLFAPQSRPEIEGMMSIPRLPVANPCL